MHRSGTSVVTQLCQAIGAYLGEKNELMVATEYNPDGYFENERISHINDKILRLSGREWYSLGKLDEDFGFMHMEKVLMELKNEIENLFQKGDMVAVKDPRISILLSSWERVLDELEIEVSYIWVFRNPLEVAESLKKRNGYSRDHSLLLWVYYNLSILRFLKEKNYLLINYRDILENQDLITKLGQFIIGEYNDNWKQNLSYIIKDSYCHSNYSKQEMWDISSKWLSDFYYLLIRNEELKLNILDLEKKYMERISQIKKNYIDYGMTESFNYLKARSVIIYGAGNYGREAASMLKQMGIEFDFCDKDINKQGTFLMNGNVLSITEVEKKKKICVIIAIENEKLIKEIEQTLICIKGLSLFSFSVLKKIYTYRMEHIN